MPEQDGISSPCRLMTFGEILAAARAAARLGLCLLYTSFKEGVAQLEEAGFHLSYIHCCNTGASERYREALDFSTHIRAGSLVLGYSDIAVA